MNMQSLVCCVGILYFVEMFFEDMIIIANQFRGPRMRLFHPLNANPRSARNNVTSRILCRICFQCAAWVLVFWSSIRSITESQSTPQSFDIQCNTFYGFYCLGFRKSCHVAVSISVEIIKTTRNWSYSGTTSRWEFTKETMKTEQSFPASANHIIWETGLDNLLDLAVCDIKMA